MIERLPFIRLLRAPLIGPVCDWLIGLRKGFGGSRRVIEVARDADMRSGLSWALPILGFLFALILMGAMKFYGEESGGFGWALFRIFVFDYTLFLFGGLSGWNMARRWRSNPDQCEELSLTPLPPSVIGSLFSGGLISIWLVLMVFYFLIDFATPIIQLKQWTWTGGSPAYLVLSALSATLVPVVLAWFHFESIRLGHWMFAIHAIPKVSLLGAGIRNFLMMTMYVVLLSGAGSIITLVLAIVLGLMAEATTNANGAIFGSYSLWISCSTAGALAVIWLKRLLTRGYESQFVRAWLQYQWWGAGERSQPRRYPAHFRPQLSLWQAFYAMKEEDEIDAKPHRRFYTRRYYAIMDNIKRMKASPPGPGPR
ncbi:MAG: hypothetical protein RLY93_02650 [Sumerlaeia bacterium]